MKGIAYGYRQDIWTKRKETKPGCTLVRFTLP